MGYFPARDVETTVACPACGGKLHITRGCREVHMNCPACRKNYPLKDFLARADKAMEDFLDNVYVDRI